MDWLNLCRTKSSCHLLAWVKKITCIVLTKCACSPPAILNVHFPNLPFPPPCLSLLVWTLSNRKWYWVLLSPRLPSWCVNMLWNQEACCNYFVMPSVRINHMWRSVVGGCCLSLSEWTWWLWTWCRTEWRDGSSLKSMCTPLLKHLWPLSILYLKTGWMWKTNKEEKGKNRPHMSFDDRDSDGVWTESVIAKL